MGLEFIYNFSQQFLLFASFLFPNLNLFPIIDEMNKNKLSLQLFKTGYSQLINQLHFFSLDEMMIMSLQNFDKLFVFFLNYDLKYIANLKLLYQLYISKSLPNYKNIIESLFLNDNYVADIIQYISYLQSRLNMNTLITESEAQTLIDKIKKIKVIYEIINPYDIQETYFITTDAQSINNNYLQLYHSNQQNEKILNHKYEYLINSMNNYVQYTMKEPELNIKEGYLIFYLPFSLFRKLKDLEQKRHDKQKLSLYFDSYHYEELIKRNEIKYNEYYIANIELINSFIVNKKTENIMILINNKIEIHSLEKIYINSFISYSIENQEINLFIGELL